MIKTIGEMQSCVNSNADMRHGDWWKNAGKVNDNCMRTHYQNTYEEYSSCIVERDVIINGEG